MAKKEYEADSIKALEGLEAVRKRPAMYIGDVGVRGLHHLVWEVVDNCIDEAMAGHATVITITLNGDGSVSVVDDGRGIPVGWHKDKNMSALTLVMTVLHAGGKFDKDSYKVSGGLHGVGVSCVNALSEWLEAEVFREGKVFFQRFERGMPQGEVEERGKSKRTGTRVVFKPDEEIFTNCDTLEYSFETVVTRAREIAFLNKGVQIEVVDERGEDEIRESFKYDGGIKSYVEFLNQNKKTIHSDVIYLESRHEETGTEIEIALQYNDGFAENVFSFVNNINTHEGGTHLSGFRSALTRCLNAWGRKNNAIKEDGALQGEDTREGLAAIISVRVPEPQFEGQTKTKLGNREVQGIVEAAVNERFGGYLEEHPGNARSIVNRAAAAAAARLAARKARDLARRKNVLSAGGMPGKLADCISRDRETTEIYLVEGDSAGGSAKSARDTRTQAILPLRGKILNVEKHRLDRVLENREITAIITALGTGIGSEEFDIEKLRYGKIIIMTDADVDGSHIRTLILTFFYRYMPELIREGHVFVAQPPLFKVTRRKKVEYVLTEEEMNRSLLTLGADGARLEVRDNGSSTVIENGGFLQLLDHIQVIQRLSRLVQRRDISFEQYLALRKEKGCFPKYRGRLEDEEVFFVDDEALNEFTAAREAEGKSVVVEEREVRLSQGPAGRNAPPTNDAESADDEPAGDEEPAVEETVMEITEFVFCKELEKAVAAIEDVGLNMDDYFAPTDPADLGKYFIVSDKDELRCRAINELVEQTCDLGERGMNLQRYKGLGEMDPEQLWETTMDPEKRTLLKVGVGDEGAADNLFTVLMGELVQPRREFIERYGPEMTDLDI